MLNCSQSQGILPRTLPSTSVVFIRSTVLAWHGTMDLQTPLGIPYLEAVKMVPHPFLQKYNEVELL